MKTIFLASLVVYSIYLYSKLTTNFHALQQNRYNRGNKYLKWVKNNINKNYLNIELLIVFIPILIFIDYKYAAMLFNSLYFIIAIFSITKNNRKATKIPLKYTSRIIRLYLTFTIIYVVLISLMMINFNSDYLIVYYIILALFSYFNNLVMLFGNLINVPIEKVIGNHYKKMAKKKLNSLTHMDVIGITGSYGKTSSKNILCTVLNSKYNAFMTPKNYNTPFGLTLTINNELDKFNDYFIAEMGACKKGEIKELCHLVKPKYGIITKIGLAHLETFKSEENIIKTKFELIESLPHDGVGILNMDDPKQVNYQIKNDCKILWIGINNKKADVYATNIKLENNKTTFDCHFKGDKKKYQFTTNLLGQANIYNILASIALGSYLGISKKELQNAVKIVKPVEHRLELKKYYDMYLIDDAYNANIDGAKMALDVLKLTNGKKIVISSGIIELGSKSYEINKELGKYMYNTCDEVILIGKEQTRPIYDGLIEKKFNKENIHILNNIMDSFTLLNELKDKNTYVLLQSDLPDIFNEK